jgi:hypothetical protein
MRSKRAFGVFGDDASHALALGTDHPETVLGRPLQTPLPI